jgi:hypothetical protein
MVAFQDDWDEGGGTPPPPSAGTGRPVQKKRRVTKTPGISRQSSNATADRTVVSGGAVPPRARERLNGIVRRTPPGDRWAR